jgi:hypothetical protein
LSKPTEHQLVELRLSTAEFKIIDKVNVPKFGFEINLRINKEKFSYSTGTISMAAASSVYGWISE